MHLVASFLAFVRPFFVISQAVVEVLTWPGDEAIRRAIGRGWLSVGLTGHLLPGCAPYFGYLPKQEEKICGHVM